MKLANKEYRILDQTALQLRLDYDFLDDELDVNQLAKAMSVTLVAYSQIESKAKEYILSKKDKISDGFFVLENGKYSSPIIFYNDEMFKYRIKFTTFLAIRRTGHSKKPKPTILRGNFSSLLAWYSCAS